MRGICCQGLAVLFVAVPSAFPQSTATTSVSADAKGVELCSSDDSAAAPVDTSKEYDLHDRQGNAEVMSAYVIREIRARIPI